ncbi:MAG: hypothetical protein ABIP78_07030 [Pyrinomonadaceae bacterium]
MNVGSELELPLSSVVRDKFLEAKNVDLDIGGTLITILPAQLSEIRDLIRAVLELKWDDRRFEKGGKTIFNPKPEFPRAAKSMTGDFEVIVEITISESASVIFAKPISGPYVFWSAAQKAALSTRFFPIYVSGTAVQTKRRVAYSFHAY